MRNPTKMSSHQWWPALVAATGPLLLVVVEAFVGPDFLWTMVGIPAVMVLWVLASVWAGWLLVRDCMHRAWRQAALNAVLPIAVILAATNPARFVRKCNEMGTVLYFNMREANYKVRVAAIPDDGQPKLAVFRRGGMPWFSVGIIYDQTDEITLPASQRSSSWNERASHSELSCGFTTKSLGGHFYIGYFDC